MAGNQEVDEKESAAGQTKVLVINNQIHEWERFLQVFFPGIEQIQFKKKYWGPKRDFLRVIGWYLWNWGVFE